MNAEEAYEYFAVSNLAVFPGRHSVYWEQAAGIGIPLLVKYWEGTTHVDVNGNCGFLYEDTVEEIYAKVLEISDSQTYNRMLNKAKKASNNFLYSNIAKKSIEL